SESRYGPSRFGWSELVSMTDGEFQYIRAPREELYDLRSDPRERDNLAEASDSMPALERLRGALSALAGKTVPSTAALVDPKDKASMVEDYRSALALASERR